MAAPKVKESKRRQYLVGTVLLIGVILLWVSSSFLMNSMFTDQNYNKPFLITYLCTATFSLYLLRPGYIFLRQYLGFHSADYAKSPVSPPPPPRPILTPSTAENGQDSDSEEDLLPAFSRPELTFQRARSRSRGSFRAPPDPPLTTRQTAFLALLFCGIWFIANWTVNASLGYTSVSSTTILSSMSGFFTLAVGALVGVDEFNLTKLASVVISVMGVIIVSKADHDLPSSSPLDLLSSDPRIPTAPLLGDALALSSALAYAFYVILLKVRIKNEERVSMPLFFGFVGLFNILLIWPVGFLLNWTKFEVFELPRGGKLWLGIAINAAITFVSDALYLKAMLMTSPLAVTLGISLTIPIAMLGDLYRGTALGWKSMLGGALVLGSFITNGLLDLAKTDREEEAALRPGLNRRASTERLLPPTTSGRKSLAPRPRAD